MANNRVCCCCRRCRRAKYFKKGRLFSKDDPKLEVLEQFLKEKPCTYSLCNDCNDQFLSFTKLDQLKRKTFGDDKDVGLIEGKKQKMYHAKPCQGIPLEDFSLWEHDGKIYNCENEEIGHKLDDVLFATQCHKQLQSLTSS